MDRTVDYEHLDVVPIIDGKISFFIPEYNLNITVPVRQIKGKGTADADKLTEVTHWHKYLIEALLDTPKRPYWTANDILKRLEIKWHFDHRIDHKEFKQNNWRRPISELLRKKIFTTTPDRPIRYHFQYDKAKRTLETGKFD